MKIYKGKRVRRAILQPEIVVTAKGYRPWNKGKPSNAPRCKECGQFLPRDGEHICKSVDLRKDRRCLICYKGLKNKGWERYSKICGPCGKKIQRQKERELRSKLIQQFGGKCEVCGYDKFEECLEFHHIDKSIKKSKHFLKDILKYPEKFELLCNRCHREKEIKNKGG